MRRFPVVRRVALVLAIAPLAAAGATAAAGASAPKSSPAPSPKPSAPKIQAMTAAKMALIPPATKEFKAATAVAGGFHIDPGDVKTATRMTVRQPSADASTSLAFVRPEGVMPRGGDGIAAMSPSVAALSVPTFNPLKIMSGDFAGVIGTAVPASLSSMGVVFRASANRNYVVTCTFEGEGRFDASILEGSNATDATADLMSAQARDGHVGTLVLAAPRLRDLTVQFTSDAAWTSSSCEITPVG